MKTTRNKVLIITAHPDDAELMFGGTINKYAQNGYIVNVLVVSSGENWNKLGITGTNVVKDIREAESRESMKILGVSEVSFLRMKDGLVDEKELIPVLIEEIRKADPNIIFTHSQSEGHQDHKEINLAVRRVCNRIEEPTPISNPFWDCKENPATNFVALYTHRFSSERINSMTRYVSLTKKNIEKKIEAIQCHKSQFCNKEEVSDKVITELHFNGIKFGVEYAEVFNLIDQISLHNREILIN